MDTNWSSMDHFSFLGLSSEEAGLRNILVNISSCILWLVMDIRSGWIVPIYPGRKRWLKLQSFNCRCVCVSGSVGRQTPVYGHLCTPCPDSENLLYWALSSLDSGFCLGWCFGEEPVGCCPAGLQWCVCLSVSPLDLSSLGSDEIRFIRVISGSLHSI